MSKIPVVYKLVKSLNKNEKRFVRLYSQLFVNNKSTHYMILFEELNKMSTYDNKILLSNIKKHFATSQLHNVKTYLKQQILEALLLFHRHKNPIIEKHQTLLFVHLLIERNLYDEALKTLNSLEKILIQEEDFDLQLQSNNLFGKILFARRNESNNDNWITEGYEAHQKNINLTELKKEIYELQKTYCELLIHKSSIEKQETRNKVENILKNQVLSRSIKEFQSFEAKHYYLECYTICIYLTTKDNDKLIMIYEEMLNLFLNSHSGPKDRKSLAFHPLIELSHHYLDIKDDDNFGRVMMTLDQNIAENTIYKKEELLYWKYLRLLNYYTVFIKKNIPNKIVIEVETFLKNKQINLNRKIGVCFFIAICHFFRKDYKETFNALENIFSYHKIPNNSFYFISISILNILCKYELGKSKLANTEFNNLKRRIERNGDFQEPLTALFKNISRLLKFNPNDKNIIPFLGEIINLEEGFLKNVIYHHKLRFILTWAKMKRDELQVS